MKFLFNRLCRLCRRPALRFCCQKYLAPEGCLGQRVRANFEGHPAILILPRHKSYGMGHFKTNKARMANFVSRLKNALKYLKFGYYSPFGLAPKYLCWPTLQIMILQFFCLIDSAKVGWVIYSLNWQIKTKVHKSNKYYFVQPQPRLPSPQPPLQRLPQSQPQRALRLGVDLWAR